MKRYRYRWVITTDQTTEAPSKLVPQILTFWQFSVVAETVDCALLLAHHEIRHAKPRRLRKAEVVQIIRREVIVAD